MIFCLLLLFDWRSAQVIRRSLPRMFLKEALFAASAWTANKREEAIPNLRKHPLSNLFVIAGEVYLRDAVLRIQNLVRMRKNDTGYLRIIGGFGVRRFPRLPCNLLFGDACRLLRR